MKKLLCIITAILVVFSLASCSVLDDIINGITQGIVGDSTDSPDDNDIENEENDDDSAELDALNQASVWYPYSDLFLIIPAL